MSHSLYPQTKDFLNEARNFGFVEIARFDLAQPVCLPPDEKTIEKAQTVVLAASDGLSCVFSTEPSGKFLASGNLLCLWEQRAPTPVLGKNIPFLKKVDVLGESHHRLFFFIKTSLMFGFRSDVPRLRSKTKGALLGPMDPVAFGWRSDVCDEMKRSLLTTGTDLKTLWNVKFDPRGGGVEAGLQALAEARFKVLPEILPKRSPFRAHIAPLFEKKNEALS